MEDGQETQVETFREEEPDFDQRMAIKNLKLQRAGLILAVLGLLFGSGILMSPLKALWGYIQSRTEPVPQYVNESGEIFSGDLINYYKNLKKSDWNTYKAGSITLHIGITTSMRIKDGKPYGKLIEYPSESIPVTVSFWRYKDSTEVYSQSAEIIFDNDNYKIVLQNDSLEAGVAYYYTVSGDGYKTAVPDEPFYLDGSDARKKIHVGMETSYRPSYSRPFLVQLVGLDGVPISNFSTKERYHIRAVSSPTSPSMYAINQETNEYGYLTTEFIVKEGCTLKIKNASGEYIDIIPQYTSVDPDKPDLAIVTLNVSEEDTE